MRREVDGPREEQVRRTLAVIFVAVDRDVDGPEQVFGRGRNCGGCGSERHDRERGTGLVGFHGRPPDVRLIGGRKLPRGGGRVKRL